MNNLFDVSSKTICVTGASSGIGRFIASLLVSKGARVIAVARREDALQQWKSEALAEGTSDKNIVLITPTIISVDLSKRANVKTLVKKLSDKFNRVDVLINAAGINTRENADEVTDKNWDLTLNLNLSTPFFLAQGLVESMKENSWGRIINFASLQSRRAFSNGIAYGASKGGVEQLTRAMAEAWSSSGVTANALAPGFFPTELTGPVFGDKVLADKNAQQTCMGRNGKLEDLAGPVLFFCSSASDYVTGQTLFVDGGFSAK